MKFIWCSYDGIGYQIAYKLLQEGNEVLVGQIQDIKELGDKDDKPEEPAVKHRRLSTYNGILKKHTMSELIQIARNLPNKDEWFVVFDFNNLWKYAEIFQKLGFKNGFFPTKEDYYFEMDRELAKKTVQENYPGLTVGEVSEFKTIDEGIQFINEHMEEFFVLKGNADEAPTVCPDTKHATLANQELLCMLEKEKESYEKSGFILEERIIDPIELTPEIVFYNGVPLWTTLDIENKPMGAGNVGKQVGCAQNLVLEIPMDSPICKAAFPPYTYEKAKKHKGLFVADAGLLLKGGKLYFTEFCSQRFGYDSWQTELSMCENVTSFFEAIMEGKSPFKYKYGAEARGLNLNGEDKEDIEMSWLEETDKNTWVFYMKMKKDKVVSADTCWDLVAFTGAGNTIDAAVNRCYEARDGFSFSNMTARPKFDFLEKSYSTAILNRYEAGLKEKLWY